MADELIERLRAVEGTRPDSLGIHTAWNRNPDGLEAATRIETLEAHVKALEGALEPFAAQKTIDEIMQDNEPPEWVNVTPERRIELMGERKRKNTADILAARQALGDGYRGGKG